MNGRTRYQVERLIAETPSLCAGCRILLPFYVAHHSALEQVTRPGRRCLVRETGKGNQWVDRHTAHLRDRGYLVRARTYGWARRMADEYSIPWLCNPPPGPARRRGPTRPLTLFTPDRDRGRERGQNRGQKRGHFPPSSKGTPARGGVPLPTVRTMPAPEPADESPGAPIDPTARAVLLEQIRAERARLAGEGAHRHPSAHHARPAPIVTASPANGGGATSARDQEPIPVPAPPVPLRALPASQRPLPTPPLPPPADPPAGSRPAPPRHRRRGLPRRRRR